MPGLALLLKSLLQATQENDWGEILKMILKGDEFLHSDVKKIIPKLQL